MSTRAAGSWLRSPIILQGTEMGLLIVRGGSFSEPLDPGTELDL
jgi:hypothetical protein